MPNSFQLVFLSSFVFVLGALVLLSQFINAKLNAAGYYVSDIILIGLPKENRTVTDHAPTTAVISETAGETTMPYAQLLALALAVVTSAFIYWKFSSSKRKPVLDPQVWQEFTLKEKVVVSPNTAIYRFALPHPEDVLGLPIGQHISVAAEINGKEIVRSYTPTSSDDNLGHFDLLIKAYELGNISKHVSLLKIGDNIRVKGPKGQFNYHPSLSRALGMIAGGTGITPMLQIIRAALKNPADRTKLNLIYANVNPEDILLKKELDELAAKHPSRFEVFYVLNNPPAGWTGGVGFVSKEQIEKHMPPTDENIKILMCGPPPMMNAMKKYLAELKYPAPRTVSKLVDQCPAMITALAPMIGMWAPVKSDRLRAYKACLQKYSPLLTISVSHSVRKMSSQTTTTPRAPMKELNESGGWSSSHTSSEANQTHPDFSDEEADVVLSSQEGILFRIHSIILKMSSSWFRTLFTLPQSSKTEQTASAMSQEVIPMSESADILEVLLSMACGKEIPISRLQSIDFIEDLLAVAEKYDMPGPSSIIRLSVSLTHVRTHPIRVYALACRWGWTEVARTASSHTLHMDLLDKKWAGELRLVGSADLARLMLLHRRRRDYLRKELDSAERFYANVVPGKCTGCNGDISHFRWHALKYAWVAVLEERPILVAEKDLLERAELLEVLDSKCPRCQKSLYNAESTLYNLRTILEQLPTDVEFEEDTARQ
ncbi:hypothetical protein EUX98_g36 [Antrodiella citrinella]|uniref:NADH-cytochrome b5 reductase 1 n=1 Tax=Antrodiella citrinella TaxID=2447956 RepID=A0A4S4N4Y9_9APHY|nr:hypothetical protein EUX98_g36 [Antrodiella citrinella]